MYKNKNQSKNKELNTINMVYLFPFYESYYFVRIYNYDTMNMQLPLHHSEITFFQKYNKAFIALKVVIVITIGNVNETT